MTRPPELHPNEPERLRALRELNLVDTPLEERFDRVTRLAKRMLGVDIVAISLVEADRQFFKSVIGLDCSGTSRDVSFCGHTILQDSIFHVHDARQDDRFANNPLVTGDPGIVFYAAHPLRSVDGHNIGSLCLIHPETREFDDHDRQCLRDLAAIAENEIRTSSANALQQALLEEVNLEQRRAMVDSLTRLWNREGIKRLAQGSLDVCAGGDMGAAFVMMDLNRFKRINDTHGHAAGDAVLATVARRLLVSIRESDHVGRLGGDEFFMVFTECDSADTASRIAERVRDSIAAPCIAPGGVEISPSASIGVTYLEPGTTATLCDVMAEADRAMYRVKRDRDEAVEVSLYRNAA